VRRAKPATWCEHDEHPKEVLVVGGGGRRVRCLECGQAGPVGESIIAAWKGLLGAAHSTSSART
jgi:hypothetical protein